MSNGAEMANYGFSCFLVRAFEDEKKAKMGVVECVKHELLDPFAVLWEREGRFSFLFRIFYMIHLSCSFS